MTTALRQRPQAAGDATATRLYETYGRQLYRFCLSRLRNAEEAEDAVQNTFLRVHTALQKGVVPRFEAAWLYKIAHNVCLSRREVLGRRTLVEALQDLDDLEHAPAAPEPRRDELQALADALAALPENLRRVILLREWQGLGYSEIAAELGVSVSAVETLVFRARRRLAAELDQRGARPARALDLAALLAGLRGLLARFGEVGAAKLAAGAALVAVGGAGVGAGITIADSQPASPRTSTPRQVSPAAAPAPARAGAAQPAANRPARRPAAVSTVSARAGAVVPFVPAAAAPSSPTGTTAAAPAGEAPPAPRATTPAAPAGSGPLAVTSTTAVPTVPTPTTPTVAAPTLDTPTLATPALPAPSVVEPPTLQTTVPTVTATTPQLPAGAPAVPTLP